MPSSINFDILSSDNGLLILLLLLVLTFEFDDVLGAEPNVWPWPGNGFVGFGGILGCWGTWPPDANWAGSSSCFFGIWCSYNVVRYCHSISLITETYSQKRNLTILDD